MAAALIRLAQCVSFTAGALRLTSARGQFVNKYVNNKVTRRSRKSELRPEFSLAGRWFYFHTHWNRPAAIFHARAWNAFTCLHVYMFNKNVCVGVEWGCCADRSSVIDGQPLYSARAAFFRPVPLFRSEILRERGRATNYFHLLPLCWFAAARFREEILKRTMQRADGNARWALFDFATSD